MRIFASAALVVLFTEDATWIQAAPLERPVQRLPLAYRDTTATCPSAPSSAITNPTHTRGPTNITPGATGKANVCAIAAIL